MYKLCNGIKSKKVPNSSDATQVKISRIANTTNMIMKSEILIKTAPRSLILEDGETSISPTLTDKSLKFCFKSGDRKIINSVLESLIFNLFLIIHMDNIFTIACMLMIPVLNPLGISTDKYNIFDVAYI